MGGARTTRAITDGWPLLPWQHGMAVHLLPEVRAIDGPELPMSLYLSDKTR